MTHQDLIRIYTQSGECLAAVWNAALEHAVKEVERTAGPAIPGEFDRGWRAGCAEAAAMIRAQKLDA